MKHVKVLSHEVPAEAYNAAWVTAKNIFSPAGRLEDWQANWLVAEVNNWLQK